MALGTDHVYQNPVTGQGPASAASRTFSNSAFVRELWEDEIIAAYKSNLVLPNLAVVMNHNGSKGDTIHVPRPNRGAPSRKVAETQVNLIQTQETSSRYNITEHWEYSRLIEDVVSIQADDSLRRFYTDDAGYGLAKKVDSDLHVTAQTLNAAGIGTQTDPTQVAASALDGAVSGGLTAGELVQWDDATTGNGAELSDESIRQFIQTLDDNDANSSGRVLVIPPVVKNQLLGIDRFTEQSFTGEVGAGNSIRNGMIGSLYGVDVYVSTNCASITSADSSPYRVALMFQQEALLHIEQLRPRAQTQYKLEYLGDLFTSDTLYGQGILRPEAGLSIVVPA